VEGYSTLRRGESSALLAFFSKKERGERKEKYGSNSLSDEDQRKAGNFSFPSDRDGKRHFSRKSPVSTLRYLKKRKRGDEGMQLLLRKKVSL